MQYKVSPPWNELSSRTSPAAVELVTDPAGTSWYADAMRELIELTGSRDAVNEQLGEEQLLRPARVRIIQRGHLRLIRS